jgi:carboxyl-terminal processing protease
VHPVAALFAILVLLPAPSAPEVTPEEAVADFEALWQHVDETYAYFDRKLTVWADVRRLYATDVQGVRTRPQLITVLERALGELYDSHTHLTANTADSPPLIPSGTDLWAEWRDGKSIIVDVRDASAAAEAGIRPLTEVIAIDGIAVADAIRPHIGRSLRTVDDEVRSWALRLALAGRRGAPRAITVLRNGRFEAVVLAPVDAVSRGDHLLTSTTLPGDIGYVRIEDSLGTSDLIAQFDATLDGLGDTSGLILDLRNTPSGGNTTVARGLLGRFVMKETPYQRHVLVGEERSSGVRRSWLELVSPRGATYRQPVAVLVNHWTGSMGEGLAIGFDATGAGTVIGTPMAGLLGATYQFELPHSRIGVNIPAERLSHVDGTPREAFSPQVRVAAESLRDSHGDVILEAALRRLRGKR